MSFRIGNSACLVQRGRCTSYSYLYLFGRDAEVGTVGVDTNVVGLAGGVSGDEVAGAEALTLDAVDGGSGCR